MLPSIASFPDLSFFLPFSPAVIRPPMTEPIHFCGQIEAVRGNQGRWQKALRGEVITWRWAGPPLPQLGDREVHAAVEEALANISSCAGLRFAQTRQGMTADITMHTGPIDGPKGILAYSHLATGDDRPLSQKYDRDEKLVIAVRPPQGYLDFLAILTHEWLHALGLDHDREGSGALMEPAYVPGRRTLQPPDVVRLQGLYGSPLPSLPPSPPPTAGGAGSQVEIQLDGPRRVVLQVSDARQIVIPGYKVVRE